MFNYRRFLGHSSKIFNFELSFHKMMEFSLVPGLLTPSYVIIFMYSYVLLFLFLLYTINLPSFGHLFCLF